jgi:probable HAF family extracellular repeat protein
LGGLRSRALGINDAGEVVGVSDTSQGRESAFLWTQQTGMIDLGAFGPGAFSAAYDIGNDGIIVGSASFPSTSGGRAAYWTPTREIHELATANPYEVAYGVGNGKIVGTSGFYNAQGQGQFQAATWQDGAISLLSSLGGTQSNEARDISSAGIVGRSSNPSNKSRAALWQGNNITDLGTLGGMGSEAHAINDNGQIVGSSLASDGIRYPFLWENGTMKDIGALLGSPSSITGEAVDINNQGQILVTNGDSSSIITVTHNPIATPSNLTVISCLPEELRLRWRDNSQNETGWIVERRTVDGPWTELARVANTEVSRFPGGTDVAYLDTGVERNRAYTYRVRAADGVDVSEPSNEQEAHTLDVAPLDAKTLKDLQKGKTVRVGEWEMTAQVTKHDGLAVKRVTVNQQQLVAEQMGVPFFDLYLGDTPERNRCELKVDSDEACERGGRSQLLSVEVVNNQHPRAFYSVDRLAPDTQSCLVILQQYDFFPEVAAANDPDAACEGSQVIPGHHPEPPCARFSPFVQYTFFPDTDALASSFEIQMAKRLHFQNWAKRPNVITVFQDCDALDLGACLTQCDPADPSCTPVK